MALCPFATIRLLPENKTEPFIKPRVAILHSAAVKVSSLYNAFNRPGNNLESHFFVQKTGGIEQYVDTIRQADANRYANAFAVSIETEDNGNPDDDPWTTAQLDSIDRLLRWLHLVHPAIPLKRATTWDGAGIGYHTMFGSPSMWTPVRKTCPGRVRVTQFDECVMPRLIGHPPDPTPPYSPTIYRNHIGGIAVASYAIKVPLDAAGEGSAPICAKDKFLALSNDAPHDKYNGDDDTIVVNCGKRIWKDVMYAVVKGGPPNGVVYPWVLVAD